MLIFTQPPTQVDSKPEPNKRTHTSKGGIGVFVRVGVGVRVGVFVGVRVGVAVLVGVYVGVAVKVAV